MTWMKGSNLIKCEVERGRIIWALDDVFLLGFCTLVDIQRHSKRSINFQKFILQKLLMLNPCPVYGWKGNLSKFWYRLSKVVHHWGCGCYYLWHAATSVGRAGLSIWHLPHHTWGSHRVLVRCEKTFERPPFSLYTTRRHMFNSACKINFWKCILLFE
jgi:hypothetical protein